MLAKFVNDSDLAIDWGLNCRAIDGFRNGSHQLDSWYLAFFWLFSGVFNANVCHQLFVTAIGVTSVAYDLKVFRDVPQPFSKVQAFNIVFDQVLSWIHFRFTSHLESARIHLLLWWGNSASLSPSVIRSNQNVCSSDSHWLLSQQRNAFLWSSFVLLNIESG